MTLASVLLLWAISLRLAALHPKATEQSSITVSKFASVVTVIALLILLWSIVDAMLSAV